MIELNYRKSGKKFMLKLCTHIKCRRRLGYVDVPVVTRWRRRAGERRLAAAITLERVVRISTVPLCCNEGEVQFQNLSLRLILLTEKVSSSVF